MGEWLLYSVTLKTRFFFWSNATAWMSLEDVLLGEQDSDRLVLFV